MVNLQNIVVANQKAQRLTLDTKVDLAVARMREVLDCHGPNVAVGWTGGKDSTVVLDLWRRVVRSGGGEHSIRVLNLDTGCKFPEVLAFRDQLTRNWNLELHIIRPGIDLRSYPLALDPVRCCRDLKIVPLNTAVTSLKIAALLTGVRADENPERNHRLWLENHEDHVRILPILEWSELDVWTYLVREGVPWCSLYDHGYRSLGCVPCTARSGQGERSGRDSRKESQMELLRSLGYF